MRRRDFLRHLTVIAAAAGLAPSALATPSRPIRVGMTPAFLHDQHTLLADWRLYLQEKLGTPVEFVQRDSYRETMDLLHLGKLDFAWVCDYPYVYLGSLVKLLAVPLNQGRPYYRSYLIVGADDFLRRSSMSDLKGAVFAFADPYSNTGYLAPRFRIRQLGGDPATFFRRTFFTWSHRKVIEAVAKGFAEAGAVDSFVWDTLNKLKPELTQGTRVIERSPEYGFPPFIAHRSVAAEDFARMQKVLLDMPKDPTGKHLLDRLNLDGFVVGDRRMYDSVADMMRVFGEQTGN
ncbi:MAG: PhnD/SsuA/transferrin family substrate-binding protein [Rhodocyclales bacterium]|nr:PhnD/SsuA/transferrin family substrate-binding protein [Rhodocyclales bacterium]